MNLKNSSTTDATSGAYVFDGNTNSLEIDNPLESSTFDASAGGFTLSAWAKIPQPASEIEIIIDNSDPEFGVSHDKEITSNYGWHISSNSNYPGKIGDNFRMESHNDSTGLWAKWTPDIPNSGYYKFYMNWVSYTDDVNPGDTPDGTTPDEAPIGIVYNGGNIGCRTIVDGSIQTEIMGHVQTGGCRGSDRCRIEIGGRAVAPIKNVTVRSMRLSVVRIWIRVN